MLSIHLNAASKSVSRYVPIAIQDLAGHRFFSKESDADGEGNGNGNGKNDPYGVKFDDGEHNLGPSTDVLSEEDRLYVSMAEDDKVQTFSDQFVNTWTPEKRKRLVERVQSRQAEKARVGEENMPSFKDWDPVKEHLLETKGIHWNNEMESKERNYRQFKAKSRRDALIEKGKDLAVEQEYGDGIAFDEKFKVPGGISDEEWHDDMLDWMKNAPSDSIFSNDEELPNFKTMGNKKVNRKNAVNLPKEELHHNNLNLLRRYITPAGQIKNRVQSQLSAKDQRKVAKMIKRARALGLIPFVGAFKVRDNGDVHTPDIDEPKEWELSLQNILKKEN